MAIQMRRGRYENFDPTRLLPGEWAVVLSGDPNTANGMALYHCFVAGTVKRIATIEDAATIIANATEDIREELTQDIASALAQVGAATNAANTATANANTATSAANAATQAATSASERAEDAIDAMGDISELAVPEMSADVRGGAKLEQHGGLALRDGALGIGSLVQESDGYARGGLAEVTAKGHAEQVQTTGKNLFLVPNGTSNGVTFTNTDKGIEIRGTSTAAWATVGRNVTGDELASLQGKTLTLSCGNSTSQDFYVNFKEYDGSTKLTEYVVGSVYGTIEPKTFTTVGNSTSVRMEVGVRNSGSVVDMVAPAQLELGSTATDYEPYTGGLPSPRPDWEQPIEVVRGRNLLPNNATSQIVNGVTFTVNSDGSVTANGTATSNAALTTVENLSLDAGSYYLSGCPSGGNQANKYAINLHATSPSISNDYEEGNGKLLNFSSETIFNIGIIIRSGVTVSNLIFYPQLVKGSTPQPYVPYGHVGMEAFSYNLFDSQLMLSPSSSSFDGEYYTVYGYSLDNAYPKASGGFPIRGEWTDSQYTLSFDGFNQDGSDNSGAVVGFLYSDNSVERVIIYGGTLSHYSLTSNAAKTISCLYWSYTSNRALKIKNVQLTKSPTELPYRPYRYGITPVPLPQRGWVAGLPDGTADSLRLDGAGKCEWELETSEVVLDGSSDESWGTGSTPLTDQFSAYVTCQSIGVYAKGPATFTEIFSTHFRALRAGSGATAGNTNCMSFNIGSGNLLINIDKTVASTLADFKTWLTTHNVTVLYPLATPVTEHTGYVDMPAIPSECTISIPELDELGIKYFVDDAVTQYGREIIARVRSEYADRITALEQAVAELATS